MIQEAMNEILSIIEKVPHLAMWVLAGLLIWKLAYIGSIFGVIRLAILSAQKMYERKVEADLKKQEIEKKPVEERYDIGGLFIKKEVKELFLSVIKEFMAASQENRGQKLTYVFQHDVEWLRDAIHEKRLRDQETKK